MYEKPQYMTPGGYRRARSNPSSHEKTPMTTREVLPRNAKSGPGKTLSPEAAKLIAEALRSMLRQK